MNKKEFEDLVKEADQHGHAERRDPEEVPSALRKYFGKLNLTEKGDTIWLVVKIIAVIIALATGSVVLAGCQLSAKEIRVETMEGPAPCKPSKSSSNSKHQTQECQPSQLQNPHLEGTASDG